MIIIVEGARGVGKTTLCKSLVFALKVRRLLSKDKRKVVSFKAQRGDDPHSDMLKFIETADKDTIYVCDRFHITEFVMRRDEMFDRGNDWLESQEATEMRMCLAGDLFEINDRLREVNANVYLLQTSWEVVKLRIRRREASRKVNASASLIAMFHAVAIVLNVPVLPNDDWGDMIKNVIRMIMEVER